MKILVVEDNLMHRESAAETLLGHEVTIVESFEKAMELMETDFSFPFEVVLTDMMMPICEGRPFSPKSFEDRQAPYGFVIALRAALRGAKFVAMVTDTNHHKDAMSNALNHLGHAYYRDGFKPNFVINGARVMFVHAPFIEKIVREAPCDSCKNGLCSKCGGSGIIPFSRNRKCECYDITGRCPKCKGTQKAEGHMKLKDWGKVLADLIT